VEFLVVAVKELALLACSKTDKSLLVSRCSAGVVDVILVAIMIFDVSSTKNSDRRFKIKLRPGRVLDTV